MCTKTAALKVVTWVRPNVTVELVVKRELS